MSDSDVNFELVRLEFGFSQQATAAEREQIVADLAALGAQAEPLFENEEDPELAALYVIPEVDEQLAGTIIQSLETLSAIEFIEKNAPRQLFTKQLDSLS